MRRREDNLKSPRTGDTRHSILDELMSPRAPASSPSPPGSPWAWWAADQIIGLNDGDAVVTWVDASGNGRNLSRGGDIAGPQYKTNILNGLPVVRYTSTPFSYHLIGPFAAVTQPRTFCGVTWSNKANAYIMDGDVVGQYLEYMYRVTSGRLGVSANGSTFLQSSADMRGAWRYSLAIFDNPNNSILRVDGVQEASSAAIGPISHTGYKVGCHHNPVGALGLEGDIAELIIYPSALNASEYAAVESYFTNKYGL